MSPDPYDYNPYASPTQPSGVPAPELPRFRPLAVLVGWLADVGASVVGGVVVGMIAAGILIRQGLPPDRLQAELLSMDWVKWMGLLVGTCGTIFGGYVGAWMGKDFPLRHALAVGILGLLTGLGAMLVLPHAQPTWIDLVGVVIGVPAALLGGYMRAARVAAIAARTPPPSY